MSKKYWEQLSFLFNLFLKGNTKINFLSLLLLKTSTNLHVITMFVDAHGPLNDYAAQPTRTYFLPSVLGSQHGI